VNAGFREKMEVTHAPPGRPSCITSGVCATGWEPMLYTESQILQFLHVTVIVTDFHHMTNAEVWFGADTLWHFSA